MPGPVGRRRRPHRTSRNRELEWRLGTGVALWTGFPVVLWVGAVVHERTPVRLAAIHAGDWLLKLLAVGALLGAWR